MERLGTGTEEFWTGRNRMAFSGQICHTLIQEGNMINQLPEFQGNVLGFEAHGEVTAEDYETVLIPVIEGALDSYQKIRLFYQIGPDFHGFTAGAMWDDAKLGLKHLRAWEKVALVTDVEWLRKTIRCFAFMIPGQVKLFGNSEADEARHWILY
jgi:hypothetical protein